MDHETEVFKAISDTRSKIGSNFGSDKIKAEGELDSAISRLLAVSLVVAHQVDFKM